MAAKPVEKPLPQAEAEMASADSPVKVVESHGSLNHVASPAHALQARIAASLNTSYHFSGRRILATVLVALLSTCVAGIIMFAALV
ncbi:MAG: hypothetical protein V7675_13585 [Hyphomonas sp.]|uniref:hypothetical protein n=1 Tax=Hyphomonas sp. TaxID=87 RepID=UPI0030024864